MRHLVLILGASLVLATLAQEQPAAPAPSRDFADLPKARVVRVEDDGLVILTRDSAERRHSLLGVRAAETLAQRDSLTVFLRNLLVGEEVFIESDADLAPNEQAVDGVEASDVSAADKPDPVYLYRAPDGLFVNLEVVRQGYATTQARPFARRELFREHERQARRFSRGIHAAPAPPARAAKAPIAPRDPERAGAPDPQTMVYVTKSGRKYHLKSCQYVKNAAQAIPLAEAVKKYEPCSRCKPPAPP